MNFGDEEKFDMKGMWNDYISNSLTLPWAFIFVIAEAFLCQPYC